MKAVVVEIKNAYAAILSDDGCITKVINKNYTIGQVIEMEEKKAKRVSRKILAMAISATAVFALFTASAWAYFTPYYYVSLDVNPSIEYKVNRFDRVIGVDAVNGDGQEILNNLNLQNQNIEDAIEDTINQLATEGYLGGTEEGGLVIATYCDNEQDRDRLRDRLHEKAQDCLQEGNINANLECYAIGLQRVQEAEKLGTTPGKLNLVEKLKESSADPDSIDIESWLDKPVKDIMKAIKDNKGNNSNKSSNANTSNASTNGESNKSGNANTSNASTNGESNKSDNANTSNASTNGESNKSDNANTSNAAISGSSNVGSTSNP